MRHSVAVATGLLLGATYACAESGALVGIEQGADAGGTDGPGNTDDGSPGFGSDVEAGLPTQGCSPDLQNVVDSNGNVVQQCPPDQGCEGGQCVSACQAAAANHGSVGCDFIVATPAFYSSSLAPYGDLPPCFAVFVSNGWGKAAKISVARAGTTYDVTTFARLPTTGADASAWPLLTAAGLPPNEVAVLFLSSDPNATNANGATTCPVADAINGATAVVNGSTQTPSSTGMGQAWHITSDVPVNGYDIIPYGGAHTALPSAELLLPTTAWGNNYVAVQPVSNDFVGAGQPWAQIVAMQDGTQVSVLPSVDLPSGGGVAGASKGMTTTYVLDAGQYVQWQFPQGATGDMSGSIFLSNNPVAFNGGNGNLCLMSASSPGGGGCDSEHRLVPPVSALGSEYALSPFPTRRADLQDESVPYRIAGTVDGTVLTFDPPISGAPSTLSLGQVVDLESTTPFVVKSQDAQHPLYVAQKMPGCQVTSGSRPGVNPTSNYGNCLGDEEQVGMVPPAQWLLKYVFFTDPTYPTTSIVVTRQVTSSGFKDVNVDCVGNVTGFKPVGSNGQYEYASVDFIRATLPNGSCGNGLHTATSAAPFGLVVWGVDSYASYGYPAGGNVRTINKVVVPPTPK